jgi:RNA polymerase sigma-70 factor (ECF subfamily)
MNDDNSLIKGCINGDRKAQRKLYEHYSERLFTVSMRYCRSDLEAEDVLQEAFIKIFNKIESFRGDSSLYYWMKRVVVHTALNNQRSKLYMYPMADVQNISIAMDEKLSLASFRLEELMKMIRNLPTGCSVIFNLYAIEGYTHKEIAEMLEISEGTSKSQYSRARSLLQNMIVKENKVLYGTGR